MLILHHHVFQGVMKIAPCLWTIQVYKLIQKLKTIRKANIKYLNWHLNQNDKNMTYC